MLQVTKQISGPSLFSLTQPEFGLRFCWLRMGRSQHYKGLIFLPLFLSMPCRVSFLIRPFPAFILHYIVFHCCWITFPWNNLLWYKVHRNELPSCVQSSILYQHNQRGNSTAVTAASFLQRSFGCMSVRLVFLLLSSLSPGRASSRA